MEPDEEQINLKTANEQIPERVTAKSVKIDDEVIALDVVRRAEKRFVFEIMRESGLVATSDEHKQRRALRGLESRSGSGQSRPMEATTDYKKNRMYLARNGVIGRPLCRLRLHRSRPPLLDSA
jgi:hypothetical protein